VTFPLQGHHATWFWAFWQKSCFWSNQVYFQCTMIFKGLEQEFQCIGICMEVVRVAQNPHLQVMQIRLGIMIPCSGCFVNLPRDTCVKLRQKICHKGKNSFTSRLCLGVRNIFPLDTQNNESRIHWGALIFFGGFESFALVALENKVEPKKKIES